MNVYTRGLVVVVLLLVGVPRGLAAPADGEPVLWDIPAAAWKRPFGDHPPGATGTHPPFEGAAIESRTKRGVPIGGIGTGSFMYNLAGTFGPWELDIGGDDSTGADWRSELNRGHEERFLAEAAFHVFQRSPTGTTVRTLATDDVLPAWPRLAVGEGSYHALFPKAWTVFESFPAPVAMKQFSPFIAGNYRAASLPVGLFQFAVANPSPDPVEVGVMLTFPNAIYRRPTTDYEYPRQGLTSTVDSRGDVLAVRLGADHPRNVPETQHTEWVIAAQAAGDTDATHVEDWSADGAGSDIIADFADDGRLSGAPLDPTPDGDAGAVALSARLEPGERVVLPFALAWDFPIVQFANPLDGTRWLKRYKQWFPGRYRALDIAEEALTKRVTWEAGIDEWWNRVALNDRYPLWLRRAALNELYYDVFGGVFWEAGCLTKPKRFGAPRGFDTNLYFTLESNVYQNAETFDVRHYETRHLLALFPRIERDVLLAWADFIRDDRHGRTPHDAGAPSNDPYFVYGQYHRTSAGEEPANPDWLDLPARFVQQVHAYWDETRDTRFLRAVYPAARRTLRHLTAKDRDGDALPESVGEGTTYDGLELRGEPALVAGLYIGALEAMAEMAAALDRGDAAQVFRARARRARRSAEAQLWRSRGRYYRMSSAGGARDALMTDALNGQRYVETHGLPPILDRDRMAAHLWRVYRRAFLPSGGTGAANVVSAAGDPLPQKQAREVWTGVNYYTAATMHRAGRVTGRQELVDAALQIGEAIHDITYVREDTAYWFDTPEAWLAADPQRFRAQQYQRARGVWELLLEVHDPFP